MSVTAQLPAAATLSLVLAAIALASPVSSGASTSSPPPSKTFKKAEAMQEESVYVGAMFLIQPSSTVVTAEKPGEIECKVRSSHVKFKCDGHLFEPTSKIEYTKKNSNMEATHAFLRIDIRQMGGRLLICTCITATEHGQWFESKKAGILKACKLPVSNNFHPILTNPICMKAHPFYSTMLKQDIMYLQFVPITSHSPGKERWGYLLLDLVFTTHTCLAFHMITGIFPAIKNILHENVRRTW